MTPSILVLTALAAVAVLAGVALAVMGKGGRMARFEADHPPLDLPADRPVSGADVGRVALPLALWGYHVRAVDEVLSRLAAALRERDARITELEHLLSERDTSRGPRLLYPHTAPYAAAERDTAGSRGPGPPREQKRSGDAEEDGAAGIASGGERQQPPGETDAAAPQRPHDT